MVGKFLSKQISLKSFQLVTSHYNDSPTLPPFSNIGSLLTPRPLKHSSWCRGHEYKPITLTSWETSLTGKGRMVSVLALVCISCWRQANPRPKSHGKLRMPSGPCREAVRLESKIFLNHSASLSLQMRTLADFSLVFCFGHVFHCVSKSSICTFSYILLTSPQLD